MEQRYPKAGNQAPGQGRGRSFFNYPYATIEESLCNAVYHKGYDTREPIEVRILPDRIEIVSHPGADRSISEEGLRTYRVFNRRYRNRRIGDFLKEMHLTEGRNTGFRKILNALERNGSPAPIFETDPERLSFCTTIFVHPQFLPSPEGRNEGRNEGRTEGKKLYTARTELILSALSQNPYITMRSLSKELNIPRSAVERILKKLREAGAVRHEGSTKNGRWVIL